MSVIAIDGPAGAGKSTVAHAVAAALGWSYLDTGAMYRAVALAALDRGIPPDSGDALGALARSLSFEPRSEGIIVDGVDVSARVRHERVTAVVSQVAAHPEVRAVLAQRQRDLARRADVVIEGRDIGAAVVPDAVLKVYLTASLATRAARRRDQLGLGDATTGEALEASLAARDEADASRAASPLTRAPDAVVIDTTELDVDEVVRRVVAEAHARGATR